jgi:hypothetical protein
MQELTYVTETTLSLHTVLLLSLYVLAGIYVIFSAILYYHWQTYSTDSQISRITLIVFFLSTFPLLLIMSLILLTI